MWSSRRGTTCESIRSSVDRLGEILPILEEVDRVHPLAGRRWVLEHVGRLRPEDIPRLARLGLYVTTIPVYQLWKNADRYLADPDGGETAVPHRMLMEAGIPVAAGSDNIPYNPFFTVWAMVARKERTTGRVIGSGQRLDAEQALRLLTRNGAWLSFEEARKGNARGRQARRPRGPFSGSAGHASRRACRDITRAADDGRRTRSSTTSRGTDSGRSRAGSSRRSAPSPARSR